MIRATYPAPALCVVIPTTAPGIPEITDPMGKNWQHPADIRDADMDSTFVRLTQRQVAGLLEYSSSFPTGTYDGKCWKRIERGVPYLMWFSDHPDPTKISLNNREISIID